MMGLFPLEFTDCLTDSPYFRENLHAHEKELEKTSFAIKDLIKQVKDLISAARTLSRAQRGLASTLKNFTFECIGNSQTDDEIIIAGSLKEFGNLLISIEDERDRMLDRAQATFIEPIENFRREQIGGAKEGKKKFDKETAKFCQSLERHLNLSTKKSENHLQEADASLEMEQRHFVQASYEYVLKLQEVHERKKFEFVETILCFMNGWLTFYHQGYESAREFKSFMTDLQFRLQRTRQNYETTQNEAESLMNKMLEVRKTKPQDPGSLNKKYTRQGYLFLMEKKAFGTSWSKHFCQYEKENRRFTMIQYNQIVGKIASTEEITLKECIRRMSDSIDKRFCFDIIPVERPNHLYTFQALSEEDRKLWLDAMDGKEPVQMNVINNSVSAEKPLTQRLEECLLDDLGFAFVQKCIYIIETRAIEEQGLYRLVGVASKVTRLIQIALDRRKCPNEMFDFSNQEEFENKTITSALKTYFRNLPEPLLTFRLYNAFIAAAKQENKIQRIETIHCLVHKLPPLNFEMLHLLVKHLCKIANHSDKNKMNVSNLGVCFGPTLLRQEEETIAGIMDIKFGNVVVEILIESCDKIFNSKPENSNVNRNLIAGSLTQLNTIAYQPQIGGNHLNYSRQQVNYDVNNSTYSRMPMKSNSQDQIAGVSQVQQYRRFPGQIGIPHQMTTSYPPPPTSYIQQPQYHQVQYSNGAQAMQRPIRPFNHTGVWVNQSNVMHQQINENHKETSPTSTSSGDSALNYQLGLPGYISQHQTSSPSTISKYVYDNRQNLANNISASTTSISSNSSNIGRRVRTKFVCVAENEGELSFEPNMIITNVRKSRESGWLEGCLNGKTGLIPENYIEYLD